MKRSIYLIVALTAVFIIGALPMSADAFGGHFGGHGHSSFRGSVWIGPGWGWGPWWGPPAYPYYYWEDPVVIQRESPTYVQPTPQTEDQYYWYFCPDAKNYYPYVKECPKGWLRVVPPRTPPDWRE